MLQIHYIRVSFARSILFFAIGLVLVALVACSGGDNGEDEKSSSGGGGSPSSPSVSSSSGGGGTSNGGGSSGGDTPGVSSGGGGTSSAGGSSSPSGLDDLGLDNAIVIKYKNGSAPEIKNDYSDKVKITTTDENVVVTIPDSIYHFVLTGSTSNGSLKISGDFKKSLYLNGVSITNSKGPAINIQNDKQIKNSKNSKRVNVHLVNGTTNFLSDADGYKCKDFAENEEQAKGAFFSEGKLEFKDGGSLEVKGKCNHAIVADNNIEIESGKITVSEAKGDGIHANDKIEVKGGEVTIKSAGDGIQSEKEAIAGVDKWNIFSGGKINIQTTDVKSHGIVSEGPITVSGKVDIAINVKGNGSKGIKSKSWVEFLGGKTSIQTSGTKHTDPKDPEDESNSAGVKLATDLLFNDGELIVKTTGVGAKGINIDGGAKVKGGKINIDAADDGIKIKGKLEITGGTINVKAGSAAGSKGKALDTGETGSCSKTGGTIDFQCGGF